VLVVLFDVVVVCSVLWRLMFCVFVCVCDGLLCVMCEVVML